MIRTSLPRTTALAAAVFSSFLGAQQWQQATPTVSPSARNSHAMVFDVARGVHVLFGGYAGDTNPPLGDTWEWNGTDWTQRAPAASPPPRWGHHLAYDSRRMRVVLFGGYVPNGPVGVFANDTWEFDGTTWTQRTVATRPAGRGYGAMAYDSARGVTVLFGGYDWPSSYFADTWEWDGASWTQRSLPASPSGRRGTAMAFDSARGQIVAFGGGDATTLSGETWTYDGTTWTLRAPAAAPGARWEGRMAFDTVRGKAVLHGGADATFATNYGDTWEWDGANWAQVAGAGPSGRHGSAMAFDARRGQTVLFGGRDAGGFLGATWQTTQATAPSGSCIRLNGIDAVGYNGNGPNRISSNTTWEAWIKIDTPGANTGYAPILWQFGLWAYGAPFIDVTQGLAGTSGGYTGLCSSPIQRTVWQHIAVVLGPEASPSNRLYVNGQLVCSVPAGTNVPGATPRRALALGAVDCCYYNFPNFSGFLKAEVDEARLSSVQRYTSNFTPQTTFSPDSATIGLWHFDEGAGSTAFDSSGNGYHFSMSGGYSWGAGLALGPAATLATYGVGCAHSTNTPALGALNNSTPRLGQALNLRMTGLPNAPFFTPLGFVGFGNTTALGLPLPFSMGLYGMPPQCQQYVEPDPALLFTLVNAGGYADWSLGLPNNPQLLGQAFFTQGLVFDWTLPYPLPAVSTNAAIATIGL